MIQLSYISFYCVFKGHVVALKEPMSSFHLRNYYDHSFHEHTSLRSPNMTHYLNPMRYHDDSIENTYCY